MNERALEIDTELTKLARTLEVDPDEVAFLAQLEVGGLRNLRWRITDLLNAADSKRLAGVIAASKLLPPALVATIGERWFGPVLCAPLVGHVEPKRGGQYARHLSVGFMADITARTDPRVVGDLIHELGLQTMQRIATALLERGDHLTLSHFVGHLPPEVVTAILEAIEANDAWHILVDIALAADALSDDVRARLRQLVDRLPKAQVARFEAAADDLGHDGLLERVLQAEG